MTVSETTTRVQYNGDGVSVNYAYPFKVFSSADLLVVKKSALDVETTLVINTHYTVTGVGTAGGNVVLVSAATCGSGETLTIIRNMELLQGTDYEDGGGLSAETIESDFDKARMVDQQLQEKIVRAIKLNISTELGEIDLPSPGAGELIGWNTAGTNLIGYSQSRTVQTIDASSVANIDELRLLTGVSGSAAQPLGYYAAGDGGGGPVRVWSTSSTATDNGGSVIKPTAIDVSAPGRWLWEHSGPVYGTWFGLRTSNTAAANTTILTTARDYLNTLGGGRIVIPDGNFPIADFTFGSAANVIIQGISQGSSYGDFKTNSVLSATTGTFAIRFPETSSYCGLEDIAIQSDGTTNTVSPFLVNDPGIEYGLFIEAGSTTIKGVTVAGFQYGAVGAQGLNSNLFDDVAFVWNTRAGWVVTPGSAAGYALHHPNISVPSSYTSSTVYTMRNCTMRRNAWGIVLREGSIRAYDVLAESNVFGGLIGWGNGLGVGDWYNSYFESNWLGFTPGAITWATSSLSDNNMLLESAGTPIALVDNASNALSDFGYQITIGGPTAGTATGPGYGYFYTPAFVQANSQKSVFIKQGHRIKFFNSSSTSGDQTNAFRFSYPSGSFLANLVHIYDHNGTLPASFGNRGAKFDSDPSKGGGVIAAFGGFGGTFYQFPAAQVPSTDANALDDYQEGTWTPVLVSTGGGANTYTRQQGTYTKIGNKITISCDLRINVDGMSNGNLTITGLPFPIGAQTSNIATRVGTWANLATNWVDVSVTGLAGESVLYLKGISSAGISNNAAAINATDVAAASFFVFNLVYFE